jgi:hypothetical protein
MLEHLLGEVLALIGQGVVVYVALGAILSPLLWLLHVVSAPAERLDRWLKRKAPQRTYTMADHLRGYAVAGAVFGLVALALHATVGLH